MIEAECCAVCIEPYKAADVVRLLPCRHEFHKICVDPWLLEHRTCPMCKMDILKHYGYVVISFFHLERHLEVEIIKTIFVFQKFTGSQESVVNMDLEAPIISGLRAGQRRATAARHTPAPTVDPSDVVITNCVTIYYILFI